MATKLAATVGSLCRCKAQGLECEGSASTKATLGLGPGQLRRSSLRVVQMPLDAWTKCFSRIRWRTSRTSPTPLAIVTNGAIQKARSGLPTGLPQWNPGTGFGAGSKFNAGEFSLVRITTFQQVWNNGTASYYNPANIPDGYHSLGCYGEVNSTTFNGWVLTISGSFDGNTPALKYPTDYTLLWNSAKINPSAVAYFWAPVVPSGYKSLGFLITTSQTKPGLQDMVLVRQDLTDTVVTDSSIYTTSGLSDIPAFSSWTTKPSVVSITALGIPVNTVYCSPAVTAQSPVPVVCLKNVNFVLDLMPTFAQAKQVLTAYGPTVYFHPDEAYLPATPQWFFDKGGLLYTESNPGSPIRITGGGANLPPGDSNDGTYWLDLPSDSTRATVQKGDLSVAKIQVHVKPLFGGIVTDVSCWLYYTFNGSSTAKVGVIVQSLNLGKIGEHVGDWEHFVLRLDNFTGELQRVYMAAHSGGSWFLPNQLEYASGNKAVVYSAKNTHALYNNIGDHLQGGSNVGLRNDTAKGKSLDSSVNYEFINVDYLGKKGESGYPKEPPWVEYLREWGPKVVYDTKTELNRIISFLPKLVRNTVLNLLNKLPEELGGEEGPTGPKEKASWAGEEK